MDAHTVITSARVVGRLAAQPSATAGRGPAPSDDVVVEFPFADHRVSRSARVVAWRPVADDESGDVAVLRLGEGVTLTAAPLVELTAPQGHRVWVHGFPAGAAARQGHARLGGNGGPAGEWIQFAPDGRLALDGFSGAPVFDLDLDGVVGIVAQRDVLLPVSYLRDVWPAVDDRLGWRLDLDPALATHWLPRARRSEAGTDTDWHFTGRHAVRARVVEWLADGDRSLLLVTGGPGTGKSALLAYLLLAGDPVLGPGTPGDGPRAPRWERSTWHCTLPGLRSTTWATDSPRRSAWTPEIRPNC